MEEVVIKLYYQQKRGYMPPLRHVRKLEMKIIKFETLLPATNKPDLLHELSWDALTFHTEQNTVCLLLQTKPHMYVGNTKVQRRTENWQ
jgi:hypothetical protein